MVKESNIVKVLEIIDAIFSKSLSISKKHFKLIDKLAVNRQVSAESLNLFVSFIIYKESLIDACSRIGLNIHEFKADNIKAELLNLKSLLSHFDSSTKLYVENKASETILYNYKLFFQDLPSQTTPQLMVNLQEEAEYDTDYLVKLLRYGIKIFRVNCAFGNYKNWKNTSINFTKAQRISNKKGQLLFDLAGGKIRIKELFNNKQQLQINSKLIIGNSKFAKNNPNFDKELYTIISTWEGYFSTCRKDEIIRFDDSKVVANIEEKHNDFIIAKVKSLSSNYAQLSIGKGINMPESNLPSLGLTDKDKNDLDFIIEHGDIVSFSFTKNFNDIEFYLKELKKRVKVLPPVVIKIETCKAIENLHEILLAGMQLPNVAILVARGDLVSECGWKALPLVQEKIYSFARAANLPVILATQILEQFNITGTPTRAEIIDFYHANKFDCLLLNKGANLFKLIEFINE